MPRQFSKLEKEIAEFEIQGGDFKVDPESFGPFCKSLVHLFRNAVDHGIETPDERLEGETLTLEISDDGRGIDPQKLIAKAQMQGLPIPENPLMLIFEESFSTKEEVSDLSGRGVGLSAVKAECEKLDGRIEVESIVGEGTTFRFFLPL